MHGATAGPVVANVTIELAADINLSWFRSFRSHAIAIVWGEGDSNIAETIS